MKSWTQTGILSLSVSLSLLVTWFVFLTSELCNCHSCSRQPQTLRFSQTFPVRDQNPVRVLAVVFPTHTHTHTHTHLSGCLSSPLWLQASPPQQTNLSHPPVFSPLLLHCSNFFIPVHHFRFFLLGFFFFFYCTIFVCRIFSHRSHQKVIVSGMFAMPHR